MLYSNNLRRKDNMINIEDFIKNLEKLSGNGKLVDIDSVYIEKDGHLSKHYFKTEQLHRIRSCSKLLVAMAVGIAIEKHLKINKEPINLDTQVYPVLKGLVNITKKENIRKIEQWTIRNLLTHTTGYKEQMMSERFIQDIDKNELLSYALNFEIPHEVGTRFAYNNVEPFIISVLFQEAFNIDLDTFIKEQIFSKLDISEFAWGKYGKYCMASTGLCLSHLDFHKIGQLLLHNGKLYGNQIVPKEWINEMCKLQIETPDYYKPERVLPKIGVGYFAFVSRDNYIFRDGSDGQYIIVNKDKNLLISILSSEKDMPAVTEILRGLI
jgi:CubicO group peptidase (beta-lactamase class C family)